MHGPHDRVPVEVLVLRSVHHHGVQLALRFRWSSARRRSKAHPPHVSLLSQPGTRPGIRPVIREPTGEKDRCVTCSRLPAAFRLPALASWASCSRHGIPPPSQLAYHHTPGAVDLTGFPRSARMRHDRVGCQLYPGSGGVHATVEPSSVAACRFATARSSSSPPPRPDPGSCRNEASPLVHARSPFRSSPHLLPPGRSGRPWASLRASHPAITDRARQRRGPVLDTDRSHVFDIKVEPPIDVLLTTCDLVSHRIAADPYTRSWPLPERLT